MPPTSLVVRSLSAHSPGEPHTFTGAFTVGRTPDCDVQVGHPLVSRHHLAVTPRPQGWLVECQGRNGMLVNGRATRSALITEGTRVQLGGASGPGLALTPVMSMTAPDTLRAPGTGYGSPLLRTIVRGRAVGRPRTSTIGRPAPAPSGASSPVPGPQRVPLSAASAESARTLLAESAPSASTGGFPAGARRTVHSVRITASGTIGRHPDNALVLADPLVSGRHARVDLTPQGIRVTDLRSTKGMYVAGRKVQDVLVTEPTVIGMGSTFVSIRPDGMCEVQVAEAGGELVGKGLTFSVNNGRLRLLDGISFSLPGNELLAVVGPSGAGKSTLLALLDGELLPTAGTVAVDGVTAARGDEAARDALRTRSAVVAQSTWLFTGTVADNLRLARPGVTDDELWAALAAAGLDAEVRAMPAGLATAVGERGTALSGGQAQRIALARAFLADRPLLLLDEPTSQVDLASEALIVEALERLGEDRTVITVTHRRAAAQGAERVLTVEGGNLR